MTKDEFFSFMELIAGAYYSFSLNDHQMDVWYRFLGHFEKGIFERVVTDYIKDYPKPPAISDLYGRCSKITGLRG